MNVSVWAAWIIFSLFFVISVLLLSGNGSFLIAGYNTSSKEKKAKYNEKRLSRVAGAGFSIITVIIGIFAFYHFEIPAAISWLVPWGLFMTIGIVLALANTVCKIK